MQIFSIEIEHLYQFPKQIICSDAGAILWHPYMWDVGYVGMMVCRVCSLEKRVGGESERGKASRQTGTTKVKYQLSQIRDNKRTNKKKSDWSGRGAAAFQLFLPPHAAQQYTIRTQPTICPTDFVAMCFMNASFQLKLVP